MFEAGGENANGGSHAGLVRLSTGHCRSFLLSPLLGNIHTTEMHFYLVCMQLPSKIEKAIHGYYVLKYRVCEGLGNHTAHEDKTSTSPKIMTFHILQNFLPGSL